MRENITTVKMYPLKFREKVLEIKERDKLSFEEIGKRFDVHPRTVQRWSVRIKPILKRNKAATKINMEELEKDVKENPDSYQWERAERLGVVPNTVLYALRRLNITYKKKLHPSKSRRREKK